jgi:hypothetical protein
MVSRLKDEKRIHANFRDENNILVKKKKTKIHSIIKNISKIKHLN